MFTWSLGWTGFFEPITPPASSMARLEMTSLAFMLVCVPLPVCQMRSGNWSSSCALGHLVGGLLDQGGQVGVELAQVAVDRGRRALQDPEGPDQGLRHGLAADVEVVQRALRLRAPVPVGGDLDLPHAVAFDPVFSSRRQLMAGELGPLRPGRSGEPMTKGRMARCLWARPRSGRRDPAHPGPCDRADLSARPGQSLLQPHRPLAPVFPRGYHFLCWIAVIDLREIGGVATSFPAGVPLDAGRQRRRPTAASQILLSGQQCEVVTGKGPSTHVADSSQALDWDGGRSFRDRRRNDGHSSVHLLRRRAGRRHLKCLRHQCHGSSGATSWPDPDGHPRRRWRADGVPRATAAGRRARAADRRHPQRRRPLDELRCSPTSRSAPGRGRGPERPERHLLCWQHALERQRGQHQCNSTAIGSTGSTTRSSVLTIGGAPSISPSRSRPTPASPRPQLGPLAGLVTITLNKQVARDRPALRRHQVDVIGLQITLLGAVCTTGS